MEILYSIFNLLFKVLQKPRIFFGMFLFCFILILLPKNWLEKLGAIGIVNQYRGLLGIIGLLVLIIWLMETYPYLVKYIAKKKKK